MEYVRGARRQPACMQHEWTALIEEWIVAYEVRAIPQRIASHDHHPRWARLHERVGSSERSNEAPRLDEPDG